MEPTEGFRFAIEDITVYNILTKTATIRSKEEQLVAVAEFANPDESGFAPVRLVLEDRAEPSLETLE